MAIAIGTPRPVVRLDHAPDNCTMVLLGASGDLAHRKLVPGALQLALDRLLPARFTVVGYRAPPTSRRRVPREPAQGCGGPVLAPRGSTSDRGAAFAEEHELLRGGLRRPAGATSGSRRRSRPIEKRTGAAGNRVFYLATPPSVLRDDPARTVGQPGSSPPRRAHAWTRIIIEKPFGRDLASARALNHDGARTPSTRRRSTASITTSARRRSRTSWCSASPTRSSSRSGTAARRPRADHRGRGRSASRAAAATTSKPARCATWCRTTCCSCSR